MLDYKANKTVAQNANLAAEDISAAEALLLQAIESEGVPEALLERLASAIEALKTAEKNGDQEGIDKAKAYCNRHKQNANGCCEHNRNAKRKKAEKGYVQGKAL